MDSSKGTTTGTSSPNTVSPRLRRIAELSRNSPGMVWTTLAHHLDMELLYEAYRRTRKDGAVGIDGQTGRAYAENLKDNLESLLNRLKSGTYRAPPVRRVFIPKDKKGQMRPIGIPTFEDKIAQRAVAMLLEAVYEQDFSDSSYGFRPGRSAHQALQTLWDRQMAMRGWVLELDIENFFGALDHGQLRQFLDKRMRDGVLRRLIDKWLQAGVMTADGIERTETGSPQGGVISPILANIYLHEVLDRWFEEDVLPRMKGKASLIRYADDALLLFARQDDAMRVTSVLAKRFARFGLNLHPDKTKLLDFRPPRRGSETQRASFVFLGFTHYWGSTRRNTWVVRRRTAPGRFGRALRRIREWCRRHRHLSLDEQHLALSRKLQGHYAYYGCTGNFDALKRFFNEVRSIWRFWLNRRSRSTPMTWQRFERIVRRRPLPRPRVVHSVYHRAANP